VCSPELLLGPVLLDLRALARSLPTAIVRVAPAAHPGFIDRDPHYWNLGSLRIPERIVFQNIGVPVEHSSSDQTEDYQRIPHNR
jgi:hypothetical protein